MQNKTTKPAVKVMLVKKGRITDTDKLLEAQQIVDLIIAIVQKLLQKFC
jgi:hypothetical protein